MTKKEELYQLTAELAKKCAYLMSKRTKEPLTLMERLERLKEDNQILQSLAELKGFSTALIYAGVFTEEDIQKICNIALPGKDLSPAVAEFIKGLKKIDEL